jgi:hypothetical protein
MRAPLKNGGMVQQKKHLKIGTLESFCRLAVPMVG